jgi:hypothetical protein
MKSGLRDENQTSNSQNLDESMNVIGYSGITEGKDTWFLYYNRISCYTQRSFPCPDDRGSHSPWMSPISSQTARCHVLIRANLNTHVRAWLRISPETICDVNNDACHLIRFKNNQSSWKNYFSIKFSANDKKPSDISDFHYGVDELAYLGCYTSHVGGYLPTFRDSLRSRLKGGGIQDHFHKAEFITCPQQPKPCPYTEPDQSKPRTDQMFVSVRPI